MTKRSLNRVFTRRPMGPRDAHEPHRAATPLELLFDLVSVIAIAAAAAGLHHAIAEAHALEGVIKFACVFFGIWWAWMNYTWFASAYDNDDTLFRLLTMVIMAGSLTMAAGISAFFQALDLTLVVIGYVMMRLAMVTLWLRASAQHTEGQQTAFWYAGGIAAVQVYWVAFLISLPLTGTGFYTLFAVGVILELVVPVLAENKGNTPWHRHHIVERYGLLTIIVLGETLLAASLALEKAYSEHFGLGLIRIAVAALVILFSMWWLYFSKEAHLESNDLSRALGWGYGHLVIFAAGAAVGAGIAVVVDIQTDHAEVSLFVGHCAVAIPIALYLLGLWYVRDRFALRNAARFVLPLFAVLILLAPMLPMALESVAALTALNAIARNHLAARATSPYVPSPPKS